MLEQIVVTIIVGGLVIWIIVKFMKLERRNLDLSVELYVNEYEILCAATKRLHYEYKVYDADQNIFNEHDQVEIRLSKDLKVGDNLRLVGHGHKDTNDGKRGDLMIVLKAVNERVQNQTPNDTDPKQ